MVSSSARARSRRRRTARPRSAPSSRRSETRSTTHRRRLRQVQHFQLEQVADDAWAALATLEGGAVANAGIVRVGDTTIVFDTSMSADAALELRAAAERIGPVVAAVSSHWHADHVNGNIAFADVDIVSTFRTRELIENRDRERLDGFETTLPNELFEEQILVDGVIVET